MSFLCFFILWLIDKKIKNVQTVKIITAYISGAYILYLLWHIMVFSKEVYSLPMQIGGFNVGLIASHIYTRTMGVVTILFITSILMFSAHYLDNKMHKFILLASSFAYSVFFNANNDGIVIMASIMLFLSLTIYCNTVTERKMINQNIFACTISYMCIVFPAQYINLPSMQQYRDMLINSIIFGCIAQIGFPTFVSRYIKFKYILHKGQIYTLLVIQFIFYNGVLLYFFTQDYLLHNSYFMHFISILMILYGGVYAIREYEVNRSLIYFTVLLEGFIILTLANITDNVAIVCKIIATASLSIMSMYFILGALRRDVNFFNIGGNNKIFAIIMSLLILSNTCIPFIGLSYTHAVLLLKTRYIYTAFYSLFWAFSAIYAMKYICFYNKTTESVNTLHINMHNFVILGSILFVTSILDTFNITISRYHNNINAIYSAKITFILSSLISVAMLMFVNMMQKIEILFTESNRFDTTILKILNMFVAVYDMTILYLSSLIKQTSNNVYHSISQIFKFFEIASRNSTKEKIENRSIIYVFILLAICTGMIMFTA